MIIQHRNMKDVAAWVVDWPDGYSREEPCKAKVWWINLLGMVGHPRPFICTPTLEVITIQNIKDWKELNIKL